MVQRLTNNAPAVNPTPALSTVRFNGAGSTAVQQGSTGLPQPFQSQLVTVLDDALANETNARGGVDPDYGEFEYHFNDCDDEDFENAREEDIQRSIWNLRARPQVRHEVSDEKNTTQGSCLFPDARVLEDTNLRRSPSSANGQPWRQQQRDFSPDTHHERS